MTGAKRNKGFIPVTVSFDPSDIELGKELATFTKIKLRSHIRSAFAQYLAANKHLLAEQNPMGFEVESNVEIAA
ncbi:MAG: hypothetical protein F6K31_06680 [Symploca sp. SIO2G7]|nr:hypothetical protein [Symploca sp. SIO2G7]